MAGARVGVAYASKEIIKLINTVKAPYNVNSLSLYLLLKNIDNQEFLNQNLENTLIEKSWLKNELQKIKYINKIYPSDANFFLIEFKNVEKVYQKLLEKEILTSKRTPQIPDCIRINVGNREENIQLVTVLKEMES
jgi:histidinol-phosphate aminotransferase